MRIKTIGKVGFVVLVLGLFMVPFGGIAFADGNNGPATPTLGDPVGTNVSPHGGYSTSTDYCLQCHGVHNTDDTTQGAYALLWKSSVTATCNTCHSLPAYAGGATGARDSNTLSGFSGGVMGTASSRAAYTGVVGVKAQHALGASDTDGTGDFVGMQESGWSYGGNPSTWAANTQDPDGLQCTSCHEAHGNFGALINSERGVVRTTADGDSSLADADTWAENTAIYTGSTVKYLHLAGSVWQGCTSPNGGGTCTNLTTTDSEGQTGIYLYGYKLLSAYPNFSWDGSGESWGLDRYTHDQARWCGTCHSRHTPSEFGGTYHNHPTGCTSCHGNPSADPTSKDFPHTSTFGNFLKSYPDGLCIGSCHTAGSLP